jgi:hypothetical protein
MFSVNERKKTTHEIECELQTAEGVARNEYSARVQFEWAIRLFYVIQGEFVLAILRRTRFL